MTWGAEWAWIPGNPWFICDRCSFKYRRNQQANKEWTSEIVCNACLDPRPPDMNPPRLWPEGVAIKDARPEPPDIFINTDDPVNPNDL